ncbi:MAG TPA: nucleotidyltransferase domain-containing protein [Candidatus Thermoplasmatota archaeon]|nr:nucleotidyltransferase domain-containing protein [Candidatus Thermoplasmatota archaeon]
MKARIRVDREKIAEFCHRRRITKLALYGSVLGDAFRAESDVDVLAEFEAEARVTLFDIVAMEDELSSILDGRRVDLRTPGDLGPRWREAVMARAETIYAEG